jgi:hypothetical protein
MQIKAGIEAAGYRTAVRDYTELTVLEELAANSYDADASTCVVLLDTGKNHLHVIDDGIGFSKDAIESVAILGGGSKREVSFSTGNRHYLGSYGYGLKSSLNIASQVTLNTVSEDGQFTGTLDWTQLDEALKPTFAGFNFAHKRRDGRHTGTHLLLKLKQPTSKDQVDSFAGVLANLPRANGKFSCFVGIYDQARQAMPGDLLNFAKLPGTARVLARRSVLKPAYASVQTDLEECEVSEIRDKGDTKVRAKFFFAGMKAGKVNQLKPGLRGIYVRINGRLLKESFTGSTFTYNISRWKKFESGLRVEIDVDWLRNQISLSREGVRFDNLKLEQEFKALLARCIGRFIQPQLKKLAIKSARGSQRKLNQRLELAKKRVRRDKSILVKGIKGGFAFRPETDGELALLLAHAEVMKKINPNYSIVDYNDQASFDCIFYDKSTMKNVLVELEPTLMEWLGHQDPSQVELIIVWSLGKWRTGATKKGTPGRFKLVADDDPATAGRYRLLEYVSEKSKTPKRTYTVACLEELL